MLYFIDMSLAQRAWKFGLHKAFTNSSKIKQPVPDWFKLRLNELSKFYENKLKR